MSCSKVLQFFKQFFYYLIQGVPIWKCNLNCGRCLKVDKAVDFSKETKKNELVVDTVIGLDAREHSLRSLLFYKIIVVNYRSLNLNRFISCCVSSFWFEDILTELCYKIM